MLGNSNTPSKDSWTQSTDTSAQLASSVASKQPGDSPASLAGGSVAARLIKETIGVSQPLETASQRCPFCSGNFSGPGLRRHLVSRHRYRCEKGCSHRAFESQRDLDRHYNTQEHSEDASSETRPPSYVCSCNKRDHRKDLHRRHVRSCKYHGHGNFFCSSCRHGTPDKGTHLIHLAQCVKQRGRKKRR